MQDFLIERRIADVGSFNPRQLAEASAASNAVLAGLDGIEWVESFVTPHATYCHYRAESEDLIREHARLSGFPADAITPVAGKISPVTGE